MRAQHGCRVLVARAVPWSGQPTRPPHPLSPLCARPVTAHNLASIFLLKIDTEGFDPFVIEGAHRMLTQRKVRFILMEYNIKWCVFCQSRAGWAGRCAQRGEAAGCLPCPTRCRPSVCPRPLTSAHVHPPFIAQV